MPNLALAVLNSELQSKPQPLVRDPAEHKKDTADAAENQADEPVALPPGQGGDGGDGDGDLEKGDAVRKNFVLMKMALGLGLLVPRLVLNFRLFFFVFLVFLLFFFRYCAAQFHLCV